MNDEVKVGSWSELGEAALALRIAVFVHEQGVPLEMEQDEADDCALHAVIMDAAGAVATGRLLPDGHIGRMAVRANARGRGLGSKLLQALRREAKHRGQAELQLHAQLGAVHFYQRAGFEAVGEPFMEAGIAHILMCQQLSA